MSSRAVHAAQILWPAFLIASILEMVVFAWVDPATISFGSLELENKAVYTIAFFVFWGLVALAAEISHWMMKAGGHGDGSLVAEAKAIRRHERRQHRHHSRSIA